MDREIRPEEVAEFEEKVLDALANVSDVSFPPIRGGAKDFTRPAPESRVAEQGFDALREKIEEGVEALYALAAAQAAARDDGLDVPPALFASVQPFIDAFGRSEEQSTSQNDPNQTGGDATASEDTTA